MSKELEHLHFIIKIEHVNLVKQIIVQLAFVCVDKNKDLLIFLHFVMEFQPIRRLRGNQL